MRNNELCDETDKLSLTLLSLLGPYHCQRYSMRPHSRLAVSISYTSLTHTALASFHNHTTCRPEAFGDQRVKSYRLACAMFLLNDCWQAFLFTSLSASLERLVSEASCYLLVQLCSRIFCHKCCKIQLPQTFLCWWTWSNDAGKMRCFPYAVQSRLYRRDQ